GAVRRRVFLQMGGFDAERARVALEVPEQFAVNVMMAIGHPGPVEELPERLREREVQSARRPVQELIFKGKFAR
ncbi:MAG TPA: nitroreductase, partial [Pseudomonadota bacterium]|nr:nitroreductase [Pseudomonadota bacterium]